MINNISSWQPASDNDPPVRIAILAPGWLQEALSILLLSENSFMLAAATQNEEELFSLSLSQAPDIIVIDADRRLNKAVGQITRIKKKLHSATCLILVEQTNQNHPLTEAGADAVILKGSPPSHILELIKQFAEKREIQSGKRGKPNTGSLSQETTPKV